MSTPRPFSVKQLLRNVVCANQNCRRKINNLSTQSIIDNRDLVQPLWEYTPLRVWCIDALIEILRKECCWNSINPSHYPPGLYVAIHLDYQHIAIGDYTTTVTSNLLLIHRSINHLSINPYEIRTGHSNPTHAKSHQPRPNVAPSATINFNNRLINHVCKSCIRKFVPPPGGKINTNSLPLSFNQFLEMLCKSSGRGWGIWLRSEMACYHSNPTHALPPPPPIITTRAWV